MARHRDIRNQSYYSEDYESEELYGRSLDEDIVAVSPATAAQFIFKRDAHESPSLLSFIHTKDSPTTASQTNATQSRPTVAPPPGFAPNSSTVRVKARTDKPDMVHVSSTPLVGFLPSERTPSPTPPPPQPLQPPSAPSSTATPGPQQLLPPPPPLQRSSSKSKHQIIDVLAEYKKRSEVAKKLINLVVIGHVDAGKSTLMGHLLYLLGHVSKKTMHKYEQESQKLGKSSFAFAWVLDETGEERSRGVTMDVAQCQFETATKTVNLLDAPGHRDFIPNMITGAAQADVALLVVDSTTGEFEAGFEAGGQTREHTLLIRSLGIRELTVAVNKMDMVGWSEERFSEILQKLKAFLRQAGFKDSDVRYVPCSGLTGDNLTSKVDSVDANWYKGPCLLDAIDHFTPPTHPVEKPFRCSIGDIFKGQGAALSVAGRVEAGHVQVGETVLVLPANELASIKAVTVNECPGPWAVAGDHVVLSVSGIEAAKLSIGSVLCTPSEPVRVTSYFQARVITFDLKVPITIGFPVLLHYQSASEPASVRKLLSVLNKSTGEVLKRKPRCLLKHQTALLEVETVRPVCLETYQTNRNLGRVTLRCGGTTIAAGVVTKV